MADDAPLPADLAWFLHGPNNCTATACAASMRWKPLTVC
jgi:hypothetical protein